VRNGVVASSQSLAVQAGVDILKRGGTAADAAVATAAMLNLVEPISAGLGGDMFAIYYSAKDNKLSGINASGWAPRAWTPSYFNALGYNAQTGMPQEGVNSVTVPGAVDGWCRLLQRFGKMSFEEVLAPAAGYAEEGFGITERIRNDWASAVPLLKQDPDSAATYLINGEAPPLYSTFRNPNLARALRLLQREGPEAFYRGPIAAAIVEKIRALGGAMTLSDLADFKAEWVTPLSTNYHGYEVCELPPNSQGWATLEMLNILEVCIPQLGYNLAELGPRSAEFWHFLVEAKKLAYDDLYTYNADPRFVNVPLERLLSKEYAATLTKLINPNRATPPRVSGGAEGGTVYLTAADRWGNMASFIYSVYTTFGSGITVPGFGFVLQNRGALFSLVPGSADIVAPRKRPFHTLMPGFIRKGNDILVSWGNKGGSEQAQAHGQEVVNFIDLGMNVQACGDAARFSHDQSADVLQLEDELYDLVGQQLQAMGHHVQQATGAPMGGYQAILFTPSGGSSGDGRPVNGMYRAGSDPRMDGEAIGW
jgi:gamma-glutamyltranspeptidase/glutathione hydrolase